ncbi:MAG: glycosyltransferase family 4 protein [Microlunatus sp.]|nr:glycosyltransferase family 4 protein [Microlunatus sp.]
MSGSLRIGLVCPYSLDRPGGVQNHILGLARTLRDLGHRPCVLAPGDARHQVDDLDLTSAGPTVPVPYNGSVARVNFGPVTAARVRQWLGERSFDLVHLHEPITPSISLLALRHTKAPVVATFHTATPRSRTMQVAGDVLRPLIEKIEAGIAVSEPAREVVVRHLGRDAVVIPNGFDHAWFAAAPKRSGTWRRGSRPRLTFLGRLDEPRKGLPVLLAALPAVRRAAGEVEVCLAGHGAPSLVAEADLAGCRILGGLNEPEKRDLLTGTDVFVAPQVGRESFGIVLLEALAAGAEVVASDLPAFVDLLSGPTAAHGSTFPRGDAGALASAVGGVLRGEIRHQPLARQHVTRYDWSTVGPAVAHVYAAVVAGARFPERSRDPVGRVRGTWSALDEALVARARRVLAMGPRAGGAATADDNRRLQRAATAALTAAAEGPAEHRERAESELSRMLAVVGLDGADGLRAEHDRATLARRLHNDAVAVAVGKRRPAGSANPPHVRAFEMAES